MLFINMNTLHEVFIKPNAYGIPQFYKDSLHNEAFEFGNNQNLFLKIVNDVTPLQVLDNLFHEKDIFCNVFIPRLLVKMEFRNIKITTFKDERIKWKDYSLGNFRFYKEFILETEEELESNAKFYPEFTFNEALNFKKFRGDDEIIFTPICFEKVEYLHDHRLYFIPQVQCKPKAEFRCENFITTDATGIDFKQGITVWKSKDIFQDLINQKQKFN